MDVMLSGTQGKADRTEPSADWVTSREGLDRLLKGYPILQLPIEDQQVILAVDFNASRALLVRMGQQPTAGYSLSLSPEGCGISGRNALISLVWKEPAQGMATAQVITHPFILLKISRGGYDAVQVVDQDGQVRFDLPVAQGTE